MRMKWRIRADMSNERYNWPDRVGKTSYRCNYTPDQDVYLPYR